MDDSTEPLNSMLDALQRLNSLTSLCSPVHYLPVTSAHLCAVLVSLFLSLSSCS